MIDAVPVIYTVSQLNSYAKGVLDKDENLAHLFVTGEISNFKAHYSGHYYMTIKDENAAIRAVMFASSAAKLRFRPEDGMKVLVFGSVTLYQKTGEYQLYINDMQPDGLGALNMAFEQLKKKLSGEGLFEASHKKAIPRFPNKVGVITSPTGAAVRDVLNVLGRRFPAAQVIFYPVQVQGAGASVSIASAIGLFNEKKEADVLIVCRGGGSLEDLWAFNEEVVARAVYASAIPVISGVGHETDYTICDFVADLRAPTPSAAAELAVPDSAILREELLKEKSHLYTLVRGSLEKERKRLALLASSPAFRSPLASLDDRRQELSALEEKLVSLETNRIQTEQSKLAALSGKLDALSPLGVLSRGYAIAFSGEKAIGSVKEVKTGDTIRVKLADGSFSAAVEQIAADKTKMECNTNDE